MSPKEHLYNQDQPYKAARPLLFEDEEGAQYIVDMLLSAQRAIEKSGAASSGHIISGDGWMCLNALDWLVEHEYLSEVTAGKNVAGQNRIYVLGANKGYTE